MGLGQVIHSLGDSISSPVLSGNEIAYSYGCQEDEIRLLNKLVAWTNKLPRLLFLVAGT